MESGAATLCRRVGHSAAPMASECSGPSAGSRGKHVHSDLKAGTHAFLHNSEYKYQAFKYPIAFNLIPQIGSPKHQGYTSEEMKMVKETRKIFEDEQIAIGVTCVRVPVLRAHCEAITFECEKPITEDEVRAILSKAPGVRIVDDRAKNYFPMPIDASGQDDVLVGRIRKDLSDASGHSISMFVSADQLLKGAALNAIQIAELLPQRAMA